MRWGQSDINRLDTNKLRKRCNDAKSKNSTAKGGKGEAILERRLKLDRRKVGQVFQSPHFPPTGKAAA
jgi:hypothetical protein